MIGGKETPWLEALITYVFNPIGQIFLHLPGATFGVLLSLVPEELVSSEPTVLS